MFNDASDTDGSSGHIPDGNSIDGKHCAAEGGINVNSKNGMDTNLPDKSRKPGTADGGISNIDAEWTCSDGVCVLRWKPKRRR